MESEVLKEYNKIIDKAISESYSDEQISEISRSAGRPDNSLDFIDVYLEDGNESIYLSPNESRRHNYAENVFHLAREKESTRSVVTPESIVKNVLPSFYHLIPKTLEERTDGKHSLSRDWLFGSDSMEDFSYPEVVIAMMAVEQGKNLELDYNWGL